MVKVREDSGSAVLDETATAETFYHVGMLPADSEVLWPIPDKDKKGKIALRGFDAWTLWNDSEKIGEKGLQIFIAKLRQYTGIAVTGMHFSGTSEYVEMGSTNTFRGAFPGSIVRLANDDLQKVVKSCYTHLIRFPQGLSKLNDPTQPTMIVDLNFGKKPAHWSEEAWNSALNSGQAIAKDEKFTPRTDKYVADFVYIKKLDIDVNEIDFEAYRKNPNKFNYQQIGPMTKKFYTSPPKSVAEVYPKA